VTSCGIPNVYEYLHLPVQSGSNAILDLMKREYTVEEFNRCVDTFKAKVPHIGISTDIICAFPGEGEAEWAETMALCRRVQFPYLNISRFYPRRDTPAAAMKQVPTNISKTRSVAITELYNSYSGFNDFLVGTTQTMWVTEVAHDKHHLLGHTKEGFVQVLIDPLQARIGDYVTVRIESANKYSVLGQVVSVDAAAVEGTCGAVTQAGTALSLAALIASVPRMAVVACCVGMGIAMALRLRSREIGTR
jgi:threonylcarbamoyladenosine tRNA methylthiotransferase CDKAL1